MEQMKYWGSYFLNVVVLAALDVPLLVKAVLSVLAGMLTVVSLLNQVDIMIGKVPKWKAFWFTRYEKLTMTKGKLKKIFNNKSGGKR